jgi:hypothetical protein
LHKKKERDRVTLNTQLTHLRYTRYSSGMSYLLVDTTSDMNTDPLVVAERYGVNGFLDGLEIGTAVPVDVDASHHGTGSFASSKY